MRQVEFYSYDYFTSLAQLSLKMEQITTVPWAYFRAHGKVLQFSCTDVRLAVLGGGCRGRRGLRLEGHKGKSWGNERTKNIKNSV